MEGWQGAITPTRLVWFRGDDAVVEPQQKEILGSIRRLGGATPQEVAVDLGHPLEEVMPRIVELANDGLVERFTRQRATEPVGVREFKAAELENAVLAVTGRGRRELEW